MKQFMRLAPADTPLRTGAMRYFVRVLLTLCVRSPVNQRLVAAHDNYAPALAAVAASLDVDMLLEALEIACAPCLLYVNALWRGCVALA